MENMNMPKFSISNEYYNEFINDKKDSSDMLQPKNVDDLSQLIDFENRRLNNPENGVSLEVLKPLSLDAYVRLFLEKSGDFYSEQSSENIRNKYFPEMTYEYFTSVFMDGEPFATYKYMPFGGQLDMWLQDPKKLLIVPFLHEGRFEWLDFVYRENEVISYGYGRDSFLYKYLPVELQHLAVNSESNLYKSLFDLYKKFRVIFLESLRRQRGK